MITIVSGKGYGQTRMVDILAPWGENPDESSRCALTTIDEPLTLENLKRMQSELIEKKIEKLPKKKKKFS